MHSELWKHRVAGLQCPFDAPRPIASEHMDLIAPLKASSLYLAANQTYRGQCLLIFDLRHATRVSELTTDEWTLFCADLHRAEGAIAQTVRPDHMNVAALGNVIPHLHWHLIPRYRDDPRWGAPIWPTNLADLPDTRLAPAERRALLDALRNLLLSASV